MKKGDRTMEVLTVIGSIISVISVIFCILTFATNRKKDAVQSAKENNLSLINFRLDQLDKNVQKILNKLDTFDKEVKEQIDEAINNHIAIYHKRTKK